MYACKGSKRRRSLTSSRKRNGASVTRVLQVVARVLQEGDRGGDSIEELGKQLK